MILLPRMENVSMTAAEFEVLDDSEVERVLRWRLAELVAAGYCWEDALRLATQVELDVQLAGDRLRPGRSPATALRILV